MFLKVNAIHCQPPDAVGCGDGKRVEEVSKGAQSRGTVCVGGQLCCEVRAWQSLPGTPVIPERHVLKNCSAQPSSTDGYLRAGMAAIGVFQLQRNTYRYRPDITNVKCRLTQAPGYSLWKPRAAGDLPGETVAGL